MQQFCKILEDTAPPLKEHKDHARDEQPYVSELAWAYYSAYRMTMMTNLLQLQVLKIGMQNFEEVTSKDNMKKILKAALPDRAQYIDQLEPEMYHWLLDELERNLLAELKEIVDGKTADKLSAERGHKIMDVIKSVEREKAQDLAASARGSV